MANFNASAGGSIPLETAKKWVAKYRASNPGATEAHYFGAASINSVLNEANSVGLRVYYAIDDDGKKQLLLVGVDAKGDNLLPEAGTEAKSSTEEGPIIVDNSIPCPPVCGSKPL